MFSADGTIYLLVKSFDEHRPLAKKTLSKIIVEHWMYGYSKISDQETNDILQAGLGFPPEPPNEIQRLEPMVFKAILNWFRDINESIVYYYAMQNKDLSAKQFGELFDDIVAVSILEMQGTTLKNIPLFNDIDLLTDNFKLEATRLEKCFFSEYLQRDKFYEAVCENLKLASFVFN